MNRFIPLLSVLTLLAVSPLLGAWADAPRRLLHLSFEADQWVEFSASSSEIYSDYPHRAEGYKGDGASISRTGETGVITAVGNLKKPQGTLSFWYKPRTGGPFERSYGLVSSGVMGKHNKNSMLVWLWDRQGGKLRFDVDPSVYLVVNCQGWEANKWVHIVCTWDHKKGIKIYVNGELEGKKEATWDVVKTLEIKIGLKTTARGVEMADGVFDELTLYDRPLTEAQVAADYRGTLKAKNAPNERTVVKKKKKGLTFKLSVDQGMTADAADGDASPIKQRGVKLAEGFKGKAAQFNGKQSVLEFTGERNLPTENGSISLWMKTHWEPAGNGFPISKVDTRKKGTPHQVFTLKSKTSKFDFMLSNFINLNWSDDRIWLAANRQVMKNTWHQYVFTWEAKTRTARVYLDGKDLGLSHQFTAFDSPFNRLTFGSMQHGIDGLIDEVSIYNFPLSPAEVMANYSKEAGLSVDLLDYAFFPVKLNRCA